MTDIKTCLDDFIGEYIWRLVKSGNRRSEEISDIIFSLRNERLTSECLEEDLCDELKKMISMQYCETVNSNRLESKGVSTKNIQLHMKSFIEKKLQQITQSLKT